MTSFTRVFTATLALAAFTTTVHAGPKAMTWAVKARQDIQVGGMTDNSKKPDWILVGAVPSTDAYAGDTLDTESRRILCFIPGNAPEPQAFTNASGNIVKQGYQDAFNGAFDPFYHAWSGGQIGLSNPHSAADVTSLAAGNQLCASEVAPNARMLEHHDNGVGGWNVGAEMAPTSDPIVRNLLKAPANFFTTSADVTHQYWVHINNQSANLWD